MKGSGGRPVLRWYPQAWRDRYGEEMAAYLEDTYGPGRLPWRAHWSLMAGGVGERARFSGIAGDRVGASGRAVAGILVVLCSWTVFVIGGSSFAKMAEHFDEALPHRMSAHRLPDLAYTVVQMAAGVAAILVVAGAMLAVPALVRFLRAGGWPAIRPRVLAAVASTVVTAVAAIPLVAWAHHLTGAQRNGGSSAYGIAFLALAALMTVTIVLWTAVAVLAARRVTFSRPVLLAETGLAVGVAVAMWVILAAAAIWWAEMAESAPSFLGSPPRLAATMGLMLIASLSGAAGVFRVTTRGVVRR